MKSLLSALALAIAGLLLTGCETSQRLNDVRIGMTKAEVIALLGTPDSTSAQANVEYLTYFLENDSSYGRDRPYMVRVVAGRVESFGRFSQLSDLYYRPVTSAQPGDPGFPSGAAYPMSVVPANPTPPASAPGNLAAQIEQLKALKDQGVLTDDEFQKAKAKLLSTP